MPDMPPEEIAMNEAFAADIRQMDAEADAEWEACEEYDAIAAAMFERGDFE